MLNSIIKEILREDSLEDYDYNYYIETFHKEILNIILDVIEGNDNGKLTLILLINIYKILLKFFRNNSDSSFFDNIPLMNNLSQDNIGFRNKQIKTLYDLLKQINKYNLIDEFALTLLKKLNKYKKIYKKRKRKIK